MCVGTVAMILIPPVMCFYVCGCVFVTGAALPGVGLGGWGGRGHEHPAGRQARGADAVGQCRGGTVKLGRGEVSL